MKTYINPSKNSWNELCFRPQLDVRDLSTTVREIIEKVKKYGDAALVNYTQMLDGATLEKLAVSDIEFQEAAGYVTDELKKAIELAADNIRRFHASQVTDTAPIETTSGVICWRESRPIESVGLYIPGGSAPLFTTVLMLGIPATLAGCEEIVICTPPNTEGKVHPAILYTAQLIGIRKVLKIGGAQAIAAMASGTASVPKVHKIFGPGNQYVTKAKELVQQDGVAIDMPAGPSEVLVIADSSAVPSFVAADLLSQAEHGVDSQVVLLTIDEEMLRSVQKALLEQLKELPRKAVAEKALENSRWVVLSTIEDCIALSNYYAPEHLILASDAANSWLGKITNAGSVFIGNYSCESAGDYASGTNHTLPTNGYAKNYSGVSLDSFVKKITFQQLSAEGLQNIGQAIEIMAEAEQLFAHKNAVTIRLNNLKNGKN